MEILSPALLVGPIHRRPVLFRGGLGHPVLSASPRGGVRASPPQDRGPPGEGGGGGLLSGHAVQYFSNGRPVPGVTVEGSPQLVSNSFHLAHESYLPSFWWGAD